MSIQMGNAQERNTEHSRFCGMVYWPRQAPEYGKTCSDCGKLNNFKGVCRSTPKQWRLTVQKKKQCMKCNKMKKADTVQMAKVIGI